MTACAVNPKNKNPRHRTAGIFISLSRMFILLAIVSSG
jgi:hypothetical protein